MTEYGRGQGSEPWHPEDPLYGDGGWAGQADDGQSSDGGRPQYYPQQPQQHYQDPQAQQPQSQYGDWGHGQQGAYGHGQQRYPDQSGGQQQYGGTPQQQYGGQSPQQYGSQGGQPYPDQGYPAQGGPDQGYPQYHDQGQDRQHYQGQQPYQGQGQQYDNGGWDNGAHTQVPYGADPVDPYTGQPASYGNQQPDAYGTPGAYPPPEPPARRRPEPRPEPEPEPEPDWDPGPDRGEHAFFADGDSDDGDEDDEAGSRRGRGGKDKRGRGGGKPKKRRSGCACLVVGAVFAGVLSGVGYFGYQFYQNRFGDAPDYAGDGISEKVSVTIPKGAGGYAIGQALKTEGVVKSVDAFVAAQAANENGGKIQPGVYTLNKKMSAASAVELMLSPKSRNNLVVTEGMRNAVVYKLIDKRLELKAGTTGDIAEKQWSKLGLPEWANNDKDIKDPLEGFLYPATYPAAKGMKPQEILKDMVRQATTKYEEIGLADKADDLKLDNPLQLLTVASLVQAEGKSKDDFKKVATVVYNRLKPTNTETYGLLDFDSTVNYLRGESKLATGSVDALRKIQDPYNTYKIKGLPPGPIGNPGDVAIRAALDPAKGNWYYFVSVSEDKTLFAETNEEQNRNREKYLKEQNGQ
ncbi:endolytic transglycosylase MltG [Streptomyces sp. NPDC008313]|uniref:endolytic transglycosylase MltG n=1 Tax=Streptomyces sp. NPDC008313 TaxID=3364826 RepID=UPI0036F0F7E8